MITVRRDAQRRHLKNGDHDIRLTFYPQDPPGPLTDGIGVLTAFDEMRLPPGGGTAPHPGDDVELLTYVHKGALAQENSTGHSGVIRAGEFQRMSTGCGIRHKETHASQTDWTHIFRISLRPCEVRSGCVCEQRRFAAAQRRNVLCVVASPDGRKGSLRIHQDALICSSVLDPGQHLIHELLPERIAWLHVVCGEATLNDIVLTQGDGVCVAAEPSVSLTAQENSEILLVDVGPAPSPIG